jgi:hypothetical protein
MRSEFPPGRVTRKVTFTVDTPAGVTDGELAEWFAAAQVAAPITPGWWISYPEVVLTGKDSTKGEGPESCRD